MWCRLTYHFFSIGNDFFLFIERFPVVFWPIFFNNFWYSSLNYSFFITLRHSSFFLTLLIISSSLSVPTEFLFSFFSSSVLIGSLRYWLTLLSKSFRVYVSLSKLACPSSTKEVISISKLFNKVWKCSDSWIGQ